MSNELLQQESAAIGKLAALLDQFILPLFFDTKNGAPKRCGSGFLVSKGSNAYLLSAAHIFDLLKEGHEPYFYTDKSTRQMLAGRVMRSRVPDGKTRADDHIDVAVLKLPAPYLPPYKEIDKRALPFDALKPAALPREGKQYLIVGFPETKTSIVNTTKQITTIRYNYRNISRPESEYQSLGLDPDTHIAIYFDRKRTIDGNGNSREFPNPQGMSGSPVWLLYDSNRENDPNQTEVIGIAIEHRSKQHTLVATDIGHAISCIENLESS